MSDDGPADEHGSAREHTSAPIAPEVTRPRLDLPILQERRSPLAGEVPAVGVAVVYAAATLGWLAAGDVLPGGRWLAVHLFTLGVLTNLVLAFSGHFARAITGQAVHASVWWLVATNVGALGVVSGIPTGGRALTAAGATLLSVSVFTSYRRIRSMRRRAPEARFGWVVRVHERAHGAFLHGAVLGALLGVGLVPGAWYGGVRIAHLHANVLGWGGLTLLATLVFLGPSMARTRIEPDAEAAAARALRVGATGLSVAVLLMILTGAGGVAGSAARVLAAIALGALAWSAVVVCRPVARAVRRGNGGAPVPLVLGACVWLVAVVWMDVAVVASGQWRWLDMLGVAALVGVLAQAVLATLLHLAPLLGTRTPAHRDAVRRRLDVASRTRAVAFNAGVGLVVLSTMLDAHAAAVGGWVLLGGVVVTALSTALLPVRGSARIVQGHV